MCVCFVLFSFYFAEELLLLSFLCFGPLSFLISFYFLLCFRLFLNFVLLSYEFSLFFIVWLCIYAICDTPIQVVFFFFFYMYDDKKEEKNQLGISNIMKDRASCLNNRIRANSEHFFVLGNCFMKFAI